MIPKWYIYNGYDRANRRYFDGAFPVTDIEIRSETSPGAEYNIVDTIEGIYNLGESYYDDFLQWRWHMRDVAPAWAVMTDEERQIFIDLHLGESADKVAHLIAQGMTLQEASQEMVVRFSENHIRIVENCQERGKAIELYRIIAKYLSITDAANFFNAVAIEFFKYTNQAIMGTNDGSGGVGLFDFIESTVGTIYENAGLASLGYVMQTGDADMTNFINELMLWFRFRLTL